MADWKLARASWDLLFLRKFRPLLYALSAGLGTARGGRGWAVWTRVRVSCDVLFLRKFRPLLYALSAGLGTARVVVLTVAARSVGARRCKRIMPTSGLSRARCSIDRKSTR